MADREWVLLNPGPANTSTSVRHALVMPDLGHREREVLDLLRRCRDRLVRLAAPASPPADTAATSGDPVRSSDWSAVLFTGSGTAAVEAAVSSVVPRERSLLVVNNGVYGDRMLRIARAHALHTVVLNYDHLTPVAPEDVEHVLHDYPDVSHVALVHHETTTGLLNPVADVVGVAARQGRRVLVDAMSSLFGEPLDLTQDGLDFVIAGASAGLQAVAGVSFVLGRRPALEALVGRPPRSVYLDLVSQWTQQEADDTLFTPAVQVLHAMEQALAELADEGVAQRLARYAENARVLREGLTRLGLSILVPEGARSNVLTTFRLPEGLPYDSLHDAMKRRGYVIDAGQGDVREHAFRVSNMGTLTPADMRKVAAAFAASLEELGVAAAAGR